MRRFTTQSGSIYEVRLCIDDAGKAGYDVRKLKSGTGQEGRLTTGQPWKHAEQVNNTEQGLVIFWGIGRDDYSPGEALEGDANSRWTFTTPVVSVEEVADV